MIIGGLQKFSLLDYPDKISAIVFTKGCNFRCQFCYNPMLVWPHKDESASNSDTYPLPSGREEENHSREEISEDDFFAFLDARKNRLEAVVITGGEPTMHADLPVFISKIRERGFLVKLDTNGTNPVMLEKLLQAKLLDYIAMDVKASPQRYEEVVGVKTDLNNIKKSVAIIVKSGLPYEFRTTLTPGLVNKKDLEYMGELIQGAAKWYLQKFIAQDDLVNNEFVKVKSFTDEDMEEFKEIAQDYVKYVSIR